METAICAWIRVDWLTLASRGFKMPSHLDSGIVISAGGYLDELVPAMKIPLLINMGDDTN